MIHARDLRRLVGLTPEVIDSVEEGFRQLGLGRVSTPVPLRLDLPSSHGEVDVKTAHVDGWDSFAIKVSTGFFDNPARGLATGGGFMAVVDAATGQIRAMLLDGGYLTTVRTAAAGAVAARWLAPPVLHTVGIVGAGEQAHRQARAIALVRRPQRMLVFARRPERASALADALSEELGMPVEPAVTLEQLVGTSEAVVTCTPAPAPLIRAEWLHPGLHITAVGSDAPGKQELEANVIKQADRVVCDLRGQCLDLGECRAAAAAGAFTDDRQPTELGRIVAGTASGRQSAAEVTVCDLTGVGVTDTAIARFAFDQARQTGSRSRRGPGRTSPADPGATRTSERY